MESCLREAYAKIPGNKAYAARQTKLTTLISNLSKLFKLSKGAMGLSEEEGENVYKVKNVADKVLHDTPIEEAEALRVFNMARSVIQSMVAKHDLKGV